MIITRLWGGLGNQLFQYAYGYSIAMQNKCDLVLDTRFYEDFFIEKNKRFTRQKVQILNLNLEHSTLYRDIDVKLPLVSILQKKNMNRLIRIPKRFNVSINNGYRYVKETRFNYDENLSQLKGQYFYLDGYWQCEKYFNKYRNEILKQFVIRSNTVEEYLNVNSIRSTCSVAVHIRRGDYVNNHNKFSNLYLLTETYYKRAMQFFTSKFGTPNFYIFTNDVKWAMDKFSDFHNCTFVNVDRNMSDIEEFQIMASCRHQIISNSTFSWWAGWLNIYPEKIVIAPDKWFGNRDIIPATWDTLSLEI
jgi:Glycosyl transferase family 11